MQHSFSLMYCFFCLPQTVFLGTVVWYLVFRLGVFGGSEISISYMITFRDVSGHLAVELTFLE